jgi:hypothetical protein
MHVMSGLAYNLPSFEVKQSSLHWGVCSSLMFYACKIVVTPPRLRVLKYVLLSTNTIGDFSYRQLPEYRKIRFALNKEITINVFFILPYSPRSIHVW